MQDKIYLLKDNQDLIFVSTSLDSVYNHLLQLLYIFYKYHNLINAHSCNISVMVKSFKIIECENNVHNDIYELNDKFELLNTRNTVYTSSKISIQNYILSLQNYISDEKFTDDNMDIFIPITLKDVTASEKVNVTPNTTNVTNNANDKPKDNDTISTLFKNVVSNSILKDKLGIDDKQSNNNTLLENLVTTAIQNVITEAIFSKLNNNTNDNKTNPANNEVVFNMVKNAADDTVNDPEVQKASEELELKNRLKEIKKEKTLKKKNLKILQKQIDEENKHRSFKEYELKTKEKDKQLLQDKRNKFLVDLDVFYKFQKEIVANKRKKDDIPEMFKQSYDLLYEMRESGILEKSEDEMFEYFISHIPKNIGSIANGEFFSIYEVPTYDEILETVNNNIEELSSDEEDENENEDDESDNESLNMIKKLRYGGGYEEMF